MQCHNYILASTKACPLGGYGRAGTKNDRLGEAVILSTGTPSTRTMDMPSAMPICSHGRRLLNDASRPRPLPMPPSDFESGPSAFAERLVKSKSALRRVDGWATVAAVDARPGGEVALVGGQRRDGSVGTMAFANPAGVGARDHLLALSARRRKRRQAGVRDFASRFGARRWQSSTHNDGVQRAASKKKRV